MNLHYHLICSNVKYKLINICVDIFYIFFSNSYLKITWKNIFTSIRLSQYFSNNIVFQTQIITQIIRVSNVSSSLMLLFEGVAREK